MSSAGTALDALVCIGDLSFHASRKLSYGAFAGIRRQGSTAMMILGEPFRFGWRISSDGLGAASILHRWTYRTQRKADRRDLTLRREQNRNANPGSAACAKY
jgi:hypothetical protein